MILKCSHCGGYLYYDSISDKMVCPYCYSSYEVADFGEEVLAEVREENPAPTEERSEAQSMGVPAKAGAEPPKAETQPFKAETPGAEISGAEISGAPAEGDAAGENAAEDGQETESVFEEPPVELIEASVCSCSSCGAKLMINDVETATFCGYCGQPTIVVERLSKMKKPKYIVPFSITKEQAHDIIKDKFGAGTYVPNEIKNFKPEILRGIYVPFKVYDVNYFDRQLIKSVVERKNHTDTFYYYREASSEFRRVTVDASVKFNDISSQRLEPYYLRYMQPFQIGYLSGYYADCIDEDNEKMRQTAISRCKELFDEELLKTVSGNKKSLAMNCPKVDVLHADYVLLPVWFLLFSDGMYHHTIMVNGQTGKMVGAVPHDPKKLKLGIAVHCAIYSTISAAVLGYLFSTMLNAFDQFFSTMVVCVAAAIISLLKYARDKAKAYKESQTLTRAYQIKHLVSDRQKE